MILENIYLENRKKYVKLDKMNGRIFFYYSYRNFGEILILESIFSDILRVVSSFYNI